MSTNRVFTVLFVDDEPWFSEPLRSTLEEEGFECITATDASEAWEELEQGRVDVVVTDIMMPGGALFLDVDPLNMGYELIRRVRLKWRNQSIICLSVIGDVEMINQLKRQRVLYLRKGETPLKTAVKLIASKATGITSFG